MERVRMLQHANGMYWATGLAKVKAPANLEDESDIPDEYICIMSGALMRDPVSCPSGQTYERIWTE